MSRPTLHKIRSGFTFLEILITVAIVATGLLALVGVIGYAAKASRTGEVASLAMGHSVHIIELIRSRNLDFSGTTVPPSPSSGLNDPPNGRRPLNDPPFSGDFKAGEIFRRNISITRMGPSGDYNYNVTLIKCTVYWQENGVDRSVSLEAQHKRP